METARRTLLHQRWGVTFLAVCAYTRTFNGADGTPTRTPGHVLQTAATILVASVAEASSFGPPTHTLQDCFVAKGSVGGGGKTICPHSFFEYLNVTTAAACADQCVANAGCISFAWALTPQGPAGQCRLSSTCKEPTAAVSDWVGYFRNSTTGECKPSAQPPAPPGVPGTWTRVFLSAAAKRGAVCIDGSPGAYYIRTANAAGVKSDPGKFVLFMEGGGWTSSDAGSVARGKTDLGSSKNYPAQPTRMEGTGLFNTPGSFDTHTIVYAKYCDGGSWTGAMSNPPRVIGNATIYYRGRGLFDALLDDLLTTQGMDKAKELLYAGCSAGGLTTYIHADSVTATMKARAPGAKVVALADAMYSLNHDDFNSDGHWPHFMSWVYHNMDSTGVSVNQLCVQAMANKYGVPKGNLSEGWRCMFGSAVAPFVATPLFVLNSKYDTWQAKQIIGAGQFDCVHTIETCPAPIKQFWVDYGNEMVKLLDALPARHGAYLHNCQSHCQTGVGPWDTDTVNGTQMSHAVATWYAAALVGTQASLPRSVDRCDVSPCGADICNGR